VDHPFSPSTLGSEDQVGGASRRVGPRSPAGKHAIACYRSHSKEPMVTARTPNVKPLFNTIWILDRRIAIQRLGLFDLPTIWFRDIFLVRATSCQFPLS
jgi:hypothetical protein